MKLATELVVNALPWMFTSRGVHLHAVEPEEVGQRARDLVHDVDRSALVVAQVGDDVDLVLQLDLALLEPLDLLDDLLELGDRRLELRDLVLLAA